MTNRAIATKPGEPTQYVDLTQEELDAKVAEEAQVAADRLQARKRVVREERNQRLQASDYVVLKAYEDKVDVAADWKTYRQALRDVPSQQGFPEEVTWPEPPSS